MRIEFVQQNATIDAEPLGNGAYIALLIIDGEKADVMTVDAKRIDEWCAQAAHEARIESLRRTQHVK